MFQRQLKLLLVKGYRSVRKELQRLGLDNPQFLLCCHRCESEKCMYMHIVILYNYLFKNMYHVPVSSPLFAY